MVAAACFSQRVRAATATLEVPWIAHCPENISLALAETEQAPLITALALDDSVALTVTELVPVIVAATSSLLSWPHRPYPQALEPQPDSTLTLS